MCSKNKQKMYRANSEIVQEKVEEHIQLAKQIAHPTKIELKFTEPFKSTINTTV